MFDTMKHPSTAVCSPPCRISDSPNQLDWLIDKKDTYQSIHIQKFIQLHQLQHIRTVYHGWRKSGPLTNWSEAQGGSGFQTPHRCSIRCIEGWISQEWIPDCQQVKEGILQWQYFICSVSRCTQPPASKYCNNFQISDLFRCGTFCFERMMLNLKPKKARKSGWTHVCIHEWLTE